VPLLVVIDLQKGVVGTPTVHPISEMASRAARLIDATTHGDAEAHRHRVEKIFRRLGETTTTDIMLKMFLGWRELLLVIALRRSQFSKLGIAVALGTDWLLIDIQLGFRTASRTIRHESSRRC
jgi:hypothetical protein